MLPNLTPDLDSTIADEVIKEGDFTVTITAGDKHYTKLAAAITAWEYTHEDAPQEFFDDYDEGEDQEGVDGEDQEEVDESLDYIALKHKVTVATIQEVSEIMERMENDDEFELTVAIVYHSSAGKPVFRHTFTGLPTARAHLKGSRSSADPLSFNLIVDCFRWSLTTLI